MEREWASVGKAGPRDPTGQKRMSCPRTAGSPRLQTLLDKGAKFRNQCEPAPAQLQCAVGLCLDSSFPPEQVLRGCTGGGHTPKGLDPSHVLPPASPLDQESEAETPKEAERLESKGFPPLTFIEL